MLEWIGEALNPGPVGSIESGGDRPRTSFTWVVVQLVLAGLVLGGAAWLALQAGATLAQLHQPKVIAGVFVYIGLAWLIQPRPDTSNMGWMGGLIDNPFRKSDDWNRNLLALSFLLLPGRIVAHAVEDAVRFVFGSSRRR